jgi:hypothetical protein
MHQCRDDATNLFLPTLCDLFQFIVRFASARRDVFTICIITGMRFQNGGRSMTIDAHASRWDHENKYQVVISIFRWHTFSALCNLRRPQAPFIYPRFEKSPLFLLDLHLESTMHGRVRDEPRGRLGGN